MAPVKRVKSRRSSLSLNKLNGGQYQLTTTADETPQSTPIYVLFRDRFIAVCAGALVMANVSLACLEPTIRYFNRFFIMIDQIFINLLSVHNLASGCRIKCKQKNGNLVSY